MGVGGSALPGVRVELNPTALDKYGIGLEQVRQVLSLANANKPKGHFSDGQRMFEVGANDQLFNAIDYKPLLIAYHNGSAVRVSDVGDALDSVEDLRNAGYSNGQPSVMCFIFRQPGANIIDTVDRIRAVLPQIHAAIPASIHLRVAMDQTQTIRASVHDVERSLVISVLLVVLVVFVFLKNPRSTFIPSVAVPVSLIGTFGVMYMFGYSLDNLSLMALTISTGFVVDDAIVVIENVTRYLEAGQTPMTAALNGAKEIGSTVVTMSISLIAVFIPLLFMQGIVGRLLREFAVTLSVAIFVSMLVSLTATPMMCGHLLKTHQRHGRLYHFFEDVFDWNVRLYGRALSFVLRHSFVTLMVLLVTIGLNVYLFIHVPKGFFPQQDNGRMSGQLLADQDASFQSMDKLLLQMENIVKQDPAVDNVIGFTGGQGGPGGASTLNQGRMFIALKPLAERKITVDYIMQRLRPKLAKVPGATLYLQANQDLRVGARNAPALYQFTMRGDNLQDLISFAPLMFRELKSIPVIVDVSSDQQDRGLQSMVTYDRETAARFGIAPQLLDDTLYDAFGQRQVSTMYKALNQYHVVMEVAPAYWQNPQILRQIYVHSPSGGQVPLSAIAHYAPAVAPLSVNHQGLFPCVTISFNLQPGVALGDAVEAIGDAALKIGLPPTIQTGFSGTAQAYQSSLSSEPYLITAALIAVYLMLGILYESYIHPVTILSTLPSAGVGALLALILTRTELSVIAMIGIILLIGLVKKNGILIVDFALAAERTQGKSPRDAIYEASLLRFRPILMTTFAAMLGALPLALGTGIGSELRRPLGVTIIGGLVMSQALTLFTTPVVYLYFDRFQHWWSRMRGVEKQPLQALDAKA